MLDRPIGAERKGDERVRPLPADTDEQTRQDLAERMTPYVRELFDDHPGLRAPATGAPQGEAFAMKTIGKALVDLYNPAQLDVLVRINALLTTISEDERLLLDLLLDGVPIAEVCARMSLSQPTVWRLRKRLQDRLRLS